MFYFAIKAVVFALMTLVGTDCTLKKGVKLSEKL